MSYKVTGSFEIHRIESETGEYEDVVAKAIPLIPSIDPATMKFQVEKELPQVVATDTDKVLVRSPDGTSYEVDLSSATPVVKEIKVEPEVRE